MSHPQPVSLVIDHVTIAGSSLAALDEAFAALELKTDYGGPHSNNVTHMSLLGFNDGSYIELISFIEPDSSKDTAFWSQHIVENGGPCAWAVYVSDVATEVKRMAALGIKADGPHYYNRRRPDGTLVEWDLAFLGDSGAGAMLPFIIKDTTPRTIRVRPSASVTGQPVTGVDTVILGVSDLAKATALFQQAYQWPAPQIQDEPIFGARLARFNSTPVVLAAPLTADSWLAQRLARFGPSPCGYLLGSQDFATAGQQFGLIDPSEWFEQPVAWFDPTQLFGIRLGIIGL